MPKALGFKPIPQTRPQLPEDMGVAAPMEHPGGNSERDSTDAPHPDANTGSNRHQTRRRGRKPRVLSITPVLVALMANVEQAANIQEFFFFAASSDAPLSFETIVESFLAATSKAFRREALKFHPDKNSDPAAVNKFLFAGKAYELLTDGERMENFKRFGNPDGPQYVQ